MRPPPVFLGTVVAAGMAWVAVPSTRAQVPSFHLVGIAPGLNGSVATGVSADGRVAAGYSYSTPATVGYTWTAAQGRFDFGLQPDVPQPPSTRTDAISGNGTTVVGTTVVSSVLQAFRYGGTGTYQTLGLLNGYERSYADSVSGDGSIVVGRCAVGPFDAGGQAFRWTSATGMQGLPPTRPGNVYSEATGISRDGGTIVGFSYDSGGFSDAFTYTVAQGILTLPSLTNPPSTGTRASAVSPDGSIVVGVSGTGASPVIWRNRQIMNLGVAPGWTQGWPLAVSDDGSVVVGYFTGGSPQTGAVWTLAHGPQTLGSYLAGSGVPVPAGVAFGASTGISGDGLTLVGTAGGSVPVQGFVATTPSPSSLTPLLLALVAAGVRRRRR